MQTETRAPNNLLIAIGLAIALGLPFTHFSILGKTYTGLGPLWGGEAAWVAFFLVILLYVRLVERRPLSSIGFRRPGVLDIALGVAAMFLIVAGDAGISRIDAIFHLQVKSQITALFATPFWYRVFVVTRAAVVEETAFRGYGFERLAELSGSRWLAAVVTFALFTLAHYPGGGLALAFAAACGGLFLTLLYLWRRNLWATIAAHWLTDAVGLLLIPALQHAAQH
ncbi:MAG TPA: type II CAAX endopeptidase family protein [Rhizomicrobium sp.]|nr:type II CAAX endopeptidase family protein [Rhizomicrobium sp.]